MNKKLIILFSLPLLLIGFGHAQLYQKSVNPANQEQIDTIVREKKANDEIQKAIQSRVQNYFNSVRRVTDRRTVYQIKKDLLQRSRVLRTPTKSVVREGALTDYSRTRTRSFRRVELAANRKSVFKKRAICYYLEGKTGLEDECFSKGNVQVSSSKNGWLWKRAESSFEKTKERSKIIMETRNLLRNKNSVKYEGTQKRTNTHLVRPTSGGSFIAPFVKRY